MNQKGLTSELRSLIKPLVYNKLVEGIFFPNGSSCKINGEQIRVPFRYRHFYPAVYEVEKTEFIRNHCKPGTTAIDIGAHLGIFSVILARLVGPQGKVYSFEPTPFTYQVLKKTIRINKLEKIVKAEQYAVSENNGETTFYVHDTSEISNANTSVAHNDTGVKPIRVTTISLDSLLNNNDLKNLSFIKIDAEGAELEILKGAEEVIAKYKPYITLEVHPNNFADAAETQRNIYGFLTDLGYRVFRDNHQMDENEFCNMGECFEVFLTPLP